MARIEWVHTHSIREDCLKYQQFIRNVGRSLSIIGKFTMLKFSIQEILTCESVLQNQANGSVALRQCFNTLANINVF
jgi:hypothetical protein